MAPPSSICSNVNFSVRSALTLSSKVLPPPISLIDCLCRTHCQQTLQKNSLLIQLVIITTFYPHSEIAQGGMDICLSCSLLCLRTGTLAGTEWYPRI